MWLEVWLRQLAPTPLQYLSFLGIGVIRGAVIFVPLAFMFPPHCQCVPTFVVKDEIASSCVRMQISTVLVFGLHRPEIRSLTGMDPHDFSRQ